MMVGALLVVWMGLGNTQTFSVAPMPDLATCERAKTAMVDRLGADWSFRARDVHCIPVPPN